MKMETKSTLIDDIEKALAEIRPLLAFHRGDIEFVEFKEGVVYVRMLGMCKGCPLSQLTLKSGVEELLKQRVIGVERVEAV
ncbi:MAG: NifU family protein [bacterium]|nr:NifU family protein [bacterium]